MWTYGDLVALRYLTALYCTSFALRYFTVLVLLYGALRYFTVRCFTVLLQYFTLLCGTLLYHGLWLPTVAYGGPRRLYDGPGGMRARAQWYGHFTVMCGHTRGRTGTWGDLW